MTGLHAASLPTSQCDPQGQAASAVSSLPSLSPQSPQQLGQLPPPVSPYGHGEVPWGAEAGLRSQVLFVFECTLCASNVSWGLFH